MTVTLALLEGLSILATSGGVLFLWKRALLTHWIDIATVLGQGAALALCFLLAFYYADLYDFRLARSLGEFVARLPRGFAGAVLLTATFYSLVPDAMLTDSPISASLLTGIGVIFGSILPLRAVAYEVLRHRPFAERVLIVGATPLASRLVEEIQARPECRYTVAGVVDDAAASVDPPSRYPLLGPLERLDKVIEEVQPDRVFVALTERRGRLPVRQLLGLRLCGIVVEDGVEVYERLTGKLAIESRRPSQLIFSKDLQPSRLPLALGRAVSILIAVVGLVGFAPLLGLIALAIKLDSRGPVLFVQDRAGKDGKPFKLLKFRTMHPAAGLTSEWVRDNSDRITRVGKWLRKFRLDELPQFVNILRGDMNLVGPRPHPVLNSQLFILLLRNAPEGGEEIPYYTLRSLVRPGITGWAQVRYGYANGLDEEMEKMRYDLYYIKHVSVWLDLRILLETVNVVLRCRGVGAPGEEPRAGRAVTPAPLRVASTLRTAPALRRVGGADTPLRPGWASQRGSRSQEAQKVG